MASDFRAQVISTPVDKSAEVRAALIKIAETYGRGICREPRRVAAMLRDLCPGQSREAFLVVAALQEQVVSDVVASLGALPEEVLSARGVSRLKDHLGLSEDSARWTMESWLPACRVLASSPERPLSFEALEQNEGGGDAASKRSIDWAWLGLCGVSVLCSAVAIAVVSRCAFFHFWNNFSGWLVETAVLTAGLAVSGLGLALAALAISRRAAPNQRALDPNRAARAMLVEVITLLALPLVPVTAVGIWAIEWSGALHMSGQIHDLAFHLGRILQTQILAVFLYFWLALTVKVQGKIASSMVRRR